jgi:hypothetical protein
MGQSEIIARKTAIPLCLEFPYAMFPMLGGSLSPQHGASSGCGWRNGLQLCRLATSIFNKQPGTDNRGGPPAWELSVGLITPHRKKTCYEQFTQKKGYLDRRGIR